MRLHFVAPLVLGFIATLLSPRLASAANLTVDGAQKFQTIDGAGVNINVNSWKGGEVKPALDMLIDTHGSSIMRVIRDPIDWVKDASQIAPLHARDAAMLQQVYETPAMQDIWSTVGYLNEKGLRGNAVMLNFMGWTPLWLGGSGRYGAESQLLLSQHAAYATVVASLVYYARKVKNLDFQLLAPLNEQDFDCKEGPCVPANQYAAALQAIVAELDAMGLTDVRLVGPDCAGDADEYLAAIRRNAGVLGRLDHFGLHSYSSASSPGPDVAGHNYWATETAEWCPGCDTGSGPDQGEWGFAKDTTNIALETIENGIAGLFIYDGYDSFYYHHNSVGFWGFVAYDQNSHVYSPRKRLFANAQIAKFVRPGAVRVSVDHNVATLGRTLAFLGPSGAVTIVGYNEGSAPADISGELLAMPAVSSLAVYQTNRTLDLAPAGKIAVTNNLFTIQVPGETIFTLTSAEPPPDVGGVGSTAGTSTAVTTSGATGAGGGGTGVTSGSARDAAPADSSGGCGCRAHRGRIPSAALALVLVAPWLAFARRRVRNRRRHLDAA